MTTQATKRQMGNCSKCGKPLTEADREQVERTMFFAHNECRADYVAAVEHTKDSDCTVGVDGLCEGCGVLHGEPCKECGGRGFHGEACSLNGVN